MTIHDVYYALTLNATGASTGAFYSVSPTSNLQISQGGASFMPTATSATMVNIYPQELQIQAPPGMVNSGVTIVTDADTISGRLFVSPPVDVATEVTLYGAGSIQLGQYILDPGVSEGLFSFPTNPAQGMSSGDALKVLQRALGQN